MEPIFNISDTPSILKFNIGQLNRLTFIFSQPMNIKVCWSYFFKQGNIFRYKMNQTLIFRRISENLSTLLTYSQEILKNYGFQCSGILKNINRGKMSICLHIELRIYFLLKRICSSVSNANFFVIWKCKMALDLSPQSRTSFWISLMVWLF